MQILAITHIDPWPPDSGGSTRTHGVVMALSRVHDVHLLTLERPQRLNRADASDNSRLTVERFPWPQRSDASRIKRWSASVAFGAPPFVLEELSPALRDRARQLSHSVDAVVFLDDYASVYLPWLAECPVVLDKHNVFGDSVGRRTPDASRTIGDLVARHLMQRFERRRVRQADAVIVTSKEENGRLQRLYGRAAEATLVTGCDLPRKQYRWRDTEPRRVGWIGSFNWIGNTRGLNRFITDGWPSLSIPTARLTVAGSGPAPSVTELAARPDIDVIGYVEDMSEFLDTVDLGIVPLWQGSGAKVKTLTFMAFGLPVVSTTLGVEGLEVQHGVHCLIADSPTEMAAAVRKVLLDKDLATRLGLAARDLVANHYTWDLLDPAFVRVVEQATVHRAHPKE